MRTLVLVLLVGCRMGFDAVPVGPIEAKLVTGVISADIEVCAADHSIATWVVTRAPLGDDVSAEDVRAAAGDAGASVAAGIDQDIPYAGCLRTTLSLADASYEAAPLYLYAAVDATISDAAPQIAAAEAALHPMFELVGFDNPDGDAEQYWIHRPEAFYRDATAPQPTLLFTHGWGDVTHGDYGTVAMAHMLTNSGLLDQYQARVPAVVNQPFIVIAPQCDHAVHDCWGWVEAVQTLEYALDDAAARGAPLDPARLYATGLSTGGEGTWRVAMQLASIHPEHDRRVAAIVPIASTYSPDRPDLGFAKAHMCDATTAAVWAFHARGDSVQPEANDLNMVSAYNDTKCGAANRAVLNIGDWTYKGVTHAGWVEVYGGTHGFTNAGMASVFDWMLSFTR